MTGPKVCIVVGLMLVASIGSSSIGSSTELHSLPFATPVLPCDGNPREFFAISNLPQTLYIRLLDLRLFAQKDMIADYGVTLFKWSDRFNGNPQVVASIGWDHYANPDRPRDAWVDFGAHWMALTAGDALVLQVSCVPVGGPWSVQIGGIVYYTTAVP